MNILTASVLDVAGRYVGVREQGSNRGMEVEKWLHAVGAKPGDSWCAAFVYSMFLEAAESANPPMVNPCPRTAGALHLWSLAPSWARFSGPSPGAIFVIDHGKGKGHVGFVEGVDPGGLDIYTIEGNTNDGGSREGDGVYRRKRARAEVTCGYIDFGHRPEERGAAPAGES